MALIIEDGTGKENAESYASIDTAAAYISKWHGTVSEWAEADEATKERALRQGTRYVDTHDFEGFPTQSNQALRFPRLTMGYVNRRWIKSDEVPNDIVHATIEATLLYLKNKNLFPEHSGSTIQAESRQVGPLSTSVTYQVPKKHKKVFEVVNALVTPFTRSGGSKRVYRAIG